MATERLAGATERLRRCVSLAVGVHSRMRIIAGPGFRGPCAGLGKACGHTAWWGWPIAGRSSRQCGALIWRGRCARTPQPGRYWRPGCSCGWVLDRGGRPRPAAAHHPAERGCGAGPVRDPRPGRSWRMGGRLLAPLADCGGGGLARFFHTSWQDAQCRSLARRRADMRLAPWVDDDAAHLAAHSAWRQSAKLRRRTGLGPTSARTVEPKKRRGTACGHARALRRRGPRRLPTSDRRWRSSKSLVPRAPCRWPAELWDARQVLREARRRW